MVENIILILTSGAGGALVSWLLNRELFRAQVSKTATETADTIVGMYREINTELRKRVRDLETEVDTLKASQCTYDARIGMMARVITAILAKINTDETVAEQLADIKDEAKITEEDLVFLKQIIADTEVQGG